MIPVDAGLLLTRIKKQIQIKQTEVDKYKYIY